MANALHRKANKADSAKVEGEMRGNLAEITKKLDKMLRDLATFVKENKEATKGLIEKALEKHQGEVKQGLRKLEERLKGGHAEGLPTDLTKFFRNYTLELYGTSILQKEREEDLSLKVIFDCIFENKLREFDMDKRFKDAISQASKSIERTLTAQFTTLLNEEVEQVDLQVTALRQQLKKKKKAEDETTMAEADVAAMQLKIQDVISELKSKSNINDVCALVDQKANSAAVFQVLDEMKRSIAFLNGKLDNDGSSVKLFEQFMKQ